MSIAIKIFMHNIMLWNSIVDLILIRIIKQTKIFIFLESFHLCKKVISYMTVQNNANTLVYFQLKRKRFIKRKLRKQTRSSF